jgi:hypothetical protein
MKTLLLILPFLIFNSAQTLTRAHFLGLQAMIQLIPSDASGANDLDSVNVYRAMNVPIQDSVLGPGKAIVTNDRILNFICAVRNNSGYECTIFLQRGSMVEMDPLKKIIKYQVSGALADELRLKFFLNQQQYKFTSTDGLFRIEAVPGSFTVYYDATGVH